ncbi:MAG: response regulator transcription factor [Lachnospiraceae bacterium]|nr:response regulator transcription factor [Lachnospiraceae bacterium]
MNFSEKVMVLEDVDAQNQAICNLLKERYPSWDIVSVTTLSRAEEELANSISSSSPFTLFLLDIQLTAFPWDRGGFTLATEIRQHKCYFQTPILFLTSISSEMSYALSNFHCYNYISKPYSFDDLIKEIEQMRATGYLKNTIIVKDTQRILHQVNAHEILWAESSFHTLNICTPNGIINTREFTLNSLFDILPSNFVRCHRKFIVNTTHIENIDTKNRLIKINYLEIPITKAFCKDYFKDSDENSEIL